MGENIYIVKMQSIEVDMLLKNI